MRRKRLARGGEALHDEEDRLEMPTAPQPVTLTPVQIDDLAAKLASLRHNVNNQLALIVAATELMRCRPESAARFINSLTDPPRKIGEEVKNFSDQLERILAITRT